MGEEDEPDDPQSSKRRLRAVREMAQLVASISVFANSVIEIFRY